MFGNLNIFHKPSSCVSPFFECKELTHYNIIESYFIFLRSDLSLVNCFHGAVRRLNVMMAFQKYVKINVEFVFGVQIAVDVVGLSHIQSVILVPEVNWRLETKN